MTVTVLTALLKAHFYVLSDQPSFTFLCNTTYLNQLPPAQVQTS